MIPDIDFSRIEGKNLLIGFYICFGLGMVIDLVVILFYPLAIIGSFIAALLIIGRVYWIRWEEHVTDPEKLKTSQSLAYVTCWIYIVLGIFTIIGIVSVLPGAIVCLLYLRRYRYPRLYDALEVA